ncbi:E3 ubiquitin/ISG15 ligase TRIM25-like isoform X2 [Micropterus salmoides]|uniref:E3 ubiquitin/ISG15 ligase TRIM25-like isoform X2 n=1 Tax=Micropterus salmoides TaxID=27706 RepID=UPI0018EAEDBD|nr:E3 ubiquitin/ISG15 ligase TRIM25-like isoform X2 [Micropterus salmoides]XP_045903751.1 E3 ubiquitin/ISG15 ligase TRIM25-like isoform X2 [Micropterus dolomieu]
MAQANISVTENQFRCPVCLEILKDPVSTPCGHTYCMSCINNYWDQANSGQFRCPQCRETFSPRPVLRRNTVLAEVVDKLKLSEMITAPELYMGGVGEVPCDFCPVESKLRAGKSCLVCLASFCELHVLPHREVGTLRRHKLVAAVECLAERLCAQHRLGLEPAGGDSDAEAAVEWIGDCPLCEADQEEVHNVDAQRARRQLQLQESQRMVQGRTRSGERELEEFQQNLESLKVSVSTVLEDSEALFADMALRLEKTKAEVRARLEAKERAVVGRAERDMEMLEKDLEELRRRDKEISQLLQSDDNAHFIQAAPLLCVPLTTARHSRSVSLPTEAFSGARRVLCHLRSRMEEVCREEVDKISRTVNENYVSGGECVKAVPMSFPLSSLSLQPADQRMRAVFLRFLCRLSLDRDTAHPTLVLLEGPQGAHCGEEPQSYPPHPQRFDSVAQVLCREGQFGGANYWEVEWRGGGWVDIGVTYRSIGRKGGGKPCLLGRNENSWRLRCTHAGYAAWHDNRKTTVAAPPCPRIGVFLERQKGALSFYSVSDTVVLLHTFRCPFSQPLYPAFRLDLDSTLLICPHEGGNGNPT